MVAPLTAPRENVLQLAKSGAEARPLRGVQAGPGARCGVPFSPAAGGRAGEGNWVRIVKLVLGVLFLLLAAKEWRGRLRGGREPKLPRWMRTVGCVTPLGSAGLGIALSAANPKNLLLAAVAAASAIAQTGTRAVDQAVALLVLIVIGTIGIGAPLAIYLPDGPARDEIS